MLTSAFIENRLYFGGGEPGSGKLNYVELPELNWKSQNLQSGEQVKVLQPLNRSLLVNNQVLDVHKARWQSLEFEVLAATVDSKMFWLGTRQGFASYDPESGAKHEWKPLKEGYFVDSNGNPKTKAFPQSRLPGAVTALSNDGDFLWMAATTRFDRSKYGNGTRGKWIDGCYVVTLNTGADSGFAGKDGHWRNMYVYSEQNDVLLFHKPTGKWVGYFPVTSRVTSLVVSGEKLWIGLEDTGYIQYGEHSWEDLEVYAPSPLLEVQKSPLESISPDKWVSDELSSDELKLRSKEAAQILKVAPDPGPVDPQVVAEQRYTFF